MIGFQPYETFQLLIETGGIERANTLLVAACEAYAQRPKPPRAEIEQFETLAQRLFPTAAPSARSEAAAKLAEAAILSPALEALIVENIGERLTGFVVNAPAISEKTLLGLVATEDASVCAAIARRGDLSNVVLAKLFKVNSRKVYRAIAANTRIKARGPYLSALARSAQMDQQVAWSLAAREDFDAALLAPAFFDLTESDRLKVVRAFAERHTPDAPIKRTLEQLSVARTELTRALMKLFAENRRAEVTRLLTQITGLDEVRCGQISHDTSGAALFVVLKAFGCDAQDGLKVLIHATSHDEDRSEVLAAFAELFEAVDVDAMAYMLSAWRGDVNLLELTKAEYIPFSRRRPGDTARSAVSETGIEDALGALDRLGARRAG